MKFTLENATQILIEFLKNPDHGNSSKYGYDIYLPTLVRNYLQKQNNHTESFENLSPTFYAAAWELCRKGIIRPGVRKHGLQATDDGQAGNGYSITPFGKQWVEEINKNELIPTEPGRIAEILASRTNRFGPGFHERSQQAVRCYQTTAYLACCAMCGAATESIILAATIEKIKNENEVLKQYSSASGRKKIENLLIGNASQYLQANYKAHSDLLKYWRDEAAHGRSSNIDEGEAYISIVSLLKFAIFIDNSWEELTKS